MEAASVRAIDAYDTPEAEALLVAGNERFAPARPTRQLAAHAGVAAAFLAAAGTIAALMPWHRQLSAVDLALVLAVWIALERVRFPVAAGWTYPTMLAFVPALFLLPVPIVPLVAVLATVSRRAVDVMRRQAPLGTIAIPVADAWFSLGPVLVIGLTGSEAFGWAHWPIYLGALLAQFACDLASTVSRCWIGEGIRPRVQLPRLAWVYIVDAALAPLGLAIAAAAAGRPGLVTLALSPLAMLYLFARDRQQRMEDTIALSTAYRGTALLLGDILEADDHYTGMHSRDVVALSLAVGAEIGLDRTRQRDLEFAALLHDVGKIHIPKEILNKPGPLDDSEWAVVRQHPVHGEEMLTMVGGTLAGVGRIVRASHERFDGQGYPDGLAGEDIPVEARIIFACDAYSAMTTDRPYRPARSTEAALAELRRCAGSQFDPKLVESIHRLLAPRQPAQDWLSRIAAPPEPSVELPQPLLSSLRRNGEPETSSERVHEPPQPASSEPPAIVIGSAARTWTAPRTTTPSPKVTSPSTTNRSASRSAGAPPGKRSSNCSSTR